MKNSVACCISTVTNIRKAPRWTTPCRSRPSLPAVTAGGRIGSGRGWHRERKRERKREEKGRKRRRGKRGRRLVRTRHLNELRPLFLPLSSFFSLLPPYSLRPSGRRRYVPNLTQSSLAGNPSRLTRTKKPRVYKTRLGHLSLINSKAMSR